MICLSLLQIDLRLSADNRRILDGEISCDLPSASSVCDGWPAACRPNHRRLVGDQLSKRCAFRRLYENPLLQLPEK